MKNDYDCPIFNDMWWKTNVLGTIKTQIVDNNLMQDK